MVVSSRYYDVLVRVLRVNTRKILSDCLNAKKVLKTKSGLCRDWRGLAFLCGVGITNHSNLPADPTDFVLSKWQAQERATIGQFLEFLGMLDRYDVIDDIEEEIRKDVERYLHLKDAVAIRAIEEEPVVNCDEDILTTDDVCRFEMGLGPQKYNAFVLYVEEEWEGAKVLIDGLEQDGYKLCLKNRDIIAGVNFEHKAMMTLIEERCDKLIVMLSPKFLESPLNQYLYLFAQSIQIERRTRKVLPCIYKDFPSWDLVPSEIRISTKLRYSDLNTWPENFWKQLKTAIMVPNAARMNSIQQSGVRIKQLPDSVNRILPSLPSSSNSEMTLSNTVQENITSTELISNNSVQNINQQSSRLDVLTEQSQDLNKISCCESDNVKEKLGKTSKGPFLSDVRRILSRAAKSLSNPLNKEPRKKCMVKCALRA